MQPTTVAAGQPPTQDAFVDEARNVYRASRMARWNSIAAAGDRSTDLSGHYHRRLAEVYQFLVSPGLSVIELG